MIRVGLISFFLISFFLLILPSPTLAQGDEIRTSLQASVMQRLGVNADITIQYGRPGVKGRKIWGDLVPYGMAPGDKYSEGKPYPWRAGANENTTIELSKDVLIEGKKLAAGKYGVHMIPSQKEWTIIFSKNNSGWGSYSYDQKDDALRVTVTPVKAPHMEWLMYGFDALAGTSATAFLHWESVKVPFKIEVPKK
jgi:hypothetical protein